MTAGVKSSVQWTIKRGFETHLSEPLVDPLCRSGVEELQNSGLAVKNRVILVVGLPREKASNSWWGTPTLKKWVCSLTKWRFSKWVGPLSEVGQHGHIYFLI